MNLLLPIINQRMIKYSSNSSKNEVLNPIKEKYCIGVFNIKTCRIKITCYFEIHAEHKFCCCTDFSQLY